MKRVVLLIIDGLGIGFMDDLQEKGNQGDQGANTLENILKSNPDLQLKNLSRFGLGRIVANRRLATTDELPVYYGKCRLKYHGADTFLGHQEIMGSRPRKNIVLPFKYVYKEIKKEIEKEGHKVTVPDPEHPYLLVDELVVVADNIEADYGQLYNVTAPLDEINFSQVLEIGQIVRQGVKVSRVIVLGGINTSSEQILNSIESPNKEVTGVNSTASGVYGKGYQVLHLGYGINPKLQVTTILASNGYDVRLIGKVQDVIHCPQASERLPMVDTEQVLKLLLDKMAEVKEGLIAVNVQETDLAGHAQDRREYARVLQKVDDYLPKILNKIEDDDLLIITADHGNDPTIGHSHHTREYTPLLVYSKGMENYNLGERETLADIAASIAEYFQVDSPEDGCSFLRAYNCFN